MKAEMRDPASAVGRGCSVDLSLLVMDLENKREHYGRCRPDEPLAWDDERNVDLDQLPGRVRGECWVNRTATTLQLSTEPILRLLSGNRGCGKSTELRRLAHRLEERNTNLLVVPIDAESVLDLRTPYAAPEVLAATVDACERAVLGLEGVDVDRELRQGYLRRLWNWLFALQNSLRKPELSPDGSPNLLLEIRANPQFRQQVAAVIAQNMTVFHENIRREVRALEERAHVRGRRGIVVLFDSLEKMQSAAGNDSEVLEGALTVFAGGAPELALPVHTIYTAPALLASRPQQVRLDFLPTIRLIDRQGKRYSPGFAAARQLLRRRLKVAALQSALGQNWEERVEELIRWSGGVPGELVRLSRELFVADTIPLDGVAFRRLLSSKVDYFRRVVRNCDCPWLARVATNHVISTENALEQASAERMLCSGAVLRFLDESEWFDLHPALYAMDSVRHAMPNGKGFTDLRPPHPLGKQALWSGSS